MAYLLVDVTYVWSIGWEMKISPIDFVHKNLKYMQYWTLFGKYDQKSGKFANPDLQALSHSFYILGIPPKFSSISLNKDHKK